MRSSVVGFENPFLCITARLRPGLTVYNIPLPGALGHQPRLLSFAKILSTLFSFYPAALSLHIYSSHRCS